jgi:hypothetical protein
VSTDVSSGGSFIAQQRRLRGFQKRTWRRRPFKAELRPVARPLAADKLKRLAVERGHAGDRRFGQVSRSLTRPRRQRGTAAVVGGGWDKRPRKGVGKAGNYLVELSSEGLSAGRQRGSIWSSMPMPVVLALCAVMTRGGHARALVAKTGPKWLKSTRVT